MAAILHGSDEDELNCMINTTPLVDVMLVLLIIFLITVPVVTKTIPIDLPNARNQAFEPRIEDIQVSVDGKGRLFWGGRLLLNQAALLKEMEKVAQLSQQPDIHVRGDQGAPYRYIHEVVLAARQTGIKQLSFVLEPHS